MADLSINLRYSLVPNTLPETEGYHRALTHMGTKDAAAIFAGVAAKLPGQTAAGVALVWGSLIETATENLVNYQYKVVVDGLTFELAIPGSTESVNGTPTEGVYVSITPSDAIRNAAAGITPVYSASQEDQPEVKYVENLATHERGEIAGTEAFRIGGNNISAEGDGESLKVVAADGTEAIAEVTEEDGYGMFITAHLQVALPPGKGKVVLMTHGKRTPEGELHQCVKSVTIIAGETPPVTPPPELTKIYSFQHEDDTEHLYDGSSAIMEGTALGGATLKFQANSSGTWSEEIAVPSDEFEVTGTKITVDGMWLADECATLDVGYTDPVRFIVTTPNGTAMIASIWSENA